MINCRVCKQNNLEKFLTLGPQPLVNSYLKADQVNESEVFYPLDVCVCRTCNFVQLGYVVDPAVMFSNYLYFSSNSAAGMKHYASMADEVKQTLGEKGFVVEIASNDGIFLRNFKGSGIKALGVEPAANVAKVAQEQGVDTLVDFFSTKSAKFISEKYGKADVILGTNVFAHIPDLDGLLVGLDSLLAVNGIAIFESPYFVDLLNHTEFDTVYHEHCSYLSIRPLVFLFKRFGLEIFDVKRFPIHGGSIRFYVKRASDLTHKVTPAVDELISLELKMELDKMETYHKFSGKVQELKVRLVSLLAKLKAEGKKIAGYGAAGKGNTLLNYFNIGPETLDFIADRSPHKVGFYTPGKRISIKAVELIASEKPDYLLILVWNFAEEVMQQQKAFHDAGGKFIIPIPEVKVV